MCVYTHTHNLEYPGYLSGSRVYTTAVVLDSILNLEIRKCSTGFILFNPPTGFSHPPNRVAGRQDLICFLFVIINWYDIAIPPCEVPGCGTFEGYRGVAGPFGDSLGELHRSNTSNSTSTAVYTAVHVHVEIEYNFGKMVSRRYCHGYCTRAFALRCYCTTTKSKLFLSRSCPILVLTTVLGCPRHTDAKNGFKNYQWPTTS